MELRVTVDRDAWKVVPDDLINCRDKEIKQMLWHFDKTKVEYMEQLLTTPAWGQQKNIPKTCKTANIRAQFNLFFLSSALLDFHFGGGVCVSGALAFAPCRVTHDVIGVSLIQVIVIQS